MGVFTGNDLSIRENEGIGFDEDDELDFDEFEEMVAISFLSRQPDEVIQEFVHSAECEQMITEGKLNKKMLIRLDKSSDLNRRQTLAAFAKAKKRNDPDYQKFIKYKSLANQFKEKVKNRYSGSVESIAKKSQRNFISGRSTSGQIKSAIDASRKETTKRGSAGAV